MTRLDLLLAYQRAKDAGFHAFAAALADLLRQQLNSPPTPATPRAESPT